MVNAASRETSLVLTGSVQGGCQIPVRGSCDARTIAKARIQQHSNRCLDDFQISDRHGQGLVPLRLRVHGLGVGFQQPDDCLREARLQEIAPVLICRRPSASPSSDIDDRSAPWSIQRFAPTRRSSNIAGFCAGWGTAAASVAPLSSEVRVWGSSVLPSAVCWSTVRGDPGGQRVHRGAAGLRTVSRAQVVGERLRGALDLGPLLRGVVDGQAREEVAERGRRAEGGAARRAAVHVHRAAWGRVESEAGETVVLSTLMWWLMEPCCGLGGRTPFWNARGTSFYRHPACEGVCQETTGTLSCMSRSCLTRGGAKYNLRRRARADTPV